MGGEEVGLEEAVEEDEQVDAVVGGGWYVGLDLVGRGDGGGGAGVGRVLAVVVWAWDVVAIPQCQAQFLEVRIED